MSAPDANARPYWQLERFGHYARALVRYYSRRGDFGVRLTASIQTACVMPKSKQVLINPEWPPHPRERLARVRVAGHERLTLTLGGLAAHEAAHIRFSGPWPGGLLGQLVNSLEDERVERLQQRDFDLGRAFTFLGDYTLLAAEQNEAFFTARAGILLWRFQHDFPHDIWHTDDPRWEQVKPLVELAWAAADTDEVIAIARQLMAILNLPEDAPEDATLTALGARDHNEAVPAALGETDGPGSGAGTPPPAPDDDLGAFGDLGERLELARPLAKQLEHILRAPRQAHQTLSRSRGRLNVRRVVRREERPFERRPVQQAKPRRVVVVQDVSGSMGAFRPDDAHYHALLTSLALELACARLGVELALVAFDDVATLERPFGMPEHEAHLKVASLASRGGTTLHRALERVVPHAAANDLVFVLCDGVLAEEDVTLSRTLVRRSPGTFVPILIGERAEPEPFERVFGRCYRAETASDIPAVVKRVLLASRMRTF